MEYADTDSGVESILKVNEYYHSFATIFYIRTEGLMSSYTPDFLVKTKNKLYMIETKAEKDLNEGNVRQKQFATLDWARRINALDPEERMGREWAYVLLGENHFYRLKENNASIEEICDLVVMKKGTAEGKLF
jgi:type III restriction enzyme